MGNAADTDVSSNNHVTEDSLNQENELQVGSVGIVEREVRIADCHILSYIL